jgi:hypothetical protein
MVTNKVRNGNSTQAMKWGNMNQICTQKCAPKILIISPQFVPYHMINLRCGLVLYMGRLKEVFPQYHIGNKSFYLGRIKNIIIGPIHINWPLQLKHMVNSIPIVLIRQIFVHIRLDYTYSSRAYS